MNRMIARLSLKARRGLFGIHVGLRTLVLLLAIPSVMGLGRPAYAQSSGLAFLEPNLTLSPDGISFANGAFTFQATDLSVGSGEFPSRLSLERVYSSTNSRSLTGFGQGWINSLEVAWEETSGPGGTTNRRIGVGGNSYFFIADGLVALDGSMMEVRTDGIYVYTHNGELIKANFDSGCSCMLVNYFQSASGEFATYTYETGKYGGFGYTNGSYRRLKSVTNSRGYRISLTYDANGYITNAQSLRVSCTTDVSTDCSVGVLGSASYTYTTMSGTASTRGWYFAGAFVVLTGATDAGGSARAYRYDGALLQDVSKVSNTASNFVHVVYTTYNPCSGAIKQDRATAFTDGMGSITTYGYANSLDASSTCFNISTVAKGGSTVMTVEAAGDQQPKSVQDGLGHITSYTYISHHQVGAPKLGYKVLESITYPDLNKIVLGRDGRDNITSITKYAKPPATDVISRSAAYPACSTTNFRTCNQPIWVQDERGNRWDYQYDDANGGLLTALAPPNADGQRAILRRSYASFYPAPGVPTPGSPLAATASLITAEDRCLVSGVTGTTVDFTYVCPDASRLRTAYGYNLSSSSAPSGHELINIVVDPGGINAVTSFRYDVAGNIFFSDGPLASADVTYTSFDAIRRVVGKRDPDPDGSGPRKSAAELRHYNVEGLLETTTFGSSNIDGSGFIPINKVLVAYDDAHREVQESTTDPTGTVTYALSQRSYDVQGRPDCTAVRMNPTTASNFGQVGSTSPCDLSPTGGFGPDRIGRVEYDAANRVIKIWSGYRTEGAGTSVATRYQWTNDDKLEHLIDPNGNQTTYSYDGFDRLRQTCFASATCSGVSDYEELTYDAASNVIGRRLRDGALFGYEYDKLNRRIKDSPPPGQTWSDVAYNYTYDLVDRLVTVTDTGFGHNVGFVYDAQGRVTKETTAFGHRDIGYDVAGRLTYLGYGDGFWLGYNYNDAGAMTSVGAMSWTDPLVSYDYDDFGRRISTTRANGVTTSYSYDDVSRLTRLFNDLAGTAYDQTLTFGVLNAQNQIVNGYNPAGQIVSRTDSNEAYAWTRHYNVNRAYTSNALNQFSAISTLMTQPTYDLRGQMTGAGGASYLYNTRGQLLQVNNVAGSTYYHDPLGRLDLDQQANQLFDWFGDKVLRELDTASGALLRRYVYGADQAPVVWYEGQGLTDRRFLDTDERGSVAAVTDGSGGALAINSYDEFGVPQLTNMGRFQYTGQMWLPTLGMYDYHSRVYSPTLGRFMQTDPIGYRDGLNWYNYVANDPVNRIDPFGLAACPGNEKNCVDNPATEHGNTLQPGPDAGTRANDEIVVTGTREKMFTDGSAIKFPSAGILEQGFRVSDQGIFPKAFTESGTQTCEGEAESRAANRLSIGDLGAGESAGHTHGGGELNPLPGPEDGAMAGATGRTAYQISRRGVFAIERTSVGYRVRMLAGGRLSRSERGELQGLIGNWNQNNGGSGKRCTFTPSR